MDCGRYSVFVFGVPARQLRIRDFPPVSKNTPILLDVMSFGGVTDDANDLLLQTTTTSTTANDADDDLLNTEWAKSDAPPPPAPLLDPVPMSTPASSAKTAGGSAPSSQGPQLAPPSSLCWCFDLRSYQPYFDVSTSLVTKRIVSSLQFYKQASTGSPDYFVQDVLSQGSGPDAYGPFWITMTLVFVVSVTSNISKWFYASTEDFEVRNCYRARVIATYSILLLLLLLRSSSTTTAAVAAGAASHPLTLSPSHPLTLSQSDLTSLVHALWIIYTFSFGIPTVSYLALRCLNANAGISFMTLFSLYGYSLTPYLPACLLCLIPSTALHWVSLLLASCASTALILRNLMGPIMESEETKARAMLGWFAGCQVIMFLCLKLVFYG